MSSGERDYEAWVKLSSKLALHRGVKLCDIDSAMLVDALELVFEAGWAATADFKAAEAALDQLKDEVEEFERAADDIDVTVAEMNLDNARLRLDEMTEIGEIFSWWKINEVDVELPERSADIRYSVPVRGEVKINCRYYWFTPDGIVVQERWEDSEKIKLISADTPLTDAVSRTLRFANAQWRAMAAFDRELSSL